MGWKSTGPPATNSFLRFSSPNCRKLSRSMSSFFLSQEWISLDNNLACKKINLYHAECFILPQSNDASTCNPFPAAFRIFCNNASTSLRNFGQSTIGHSGAGVHVASGYRLSLPIQRNPRITCHFDKV